MYDIIKNAEKYGAASRRSFAAPRQPETERDQNAEQQQEGNTQQRRSGEGRARQSKQPPGEGNLDRHLDRRAQRKTGLPLVQPAAQRAVAQGIPQALGIGGAVPFFLVHARPP